MNEPMFYIQNRGYCGDCLLWWRIDAKGYTTNLDEAWCVPESQAREICRSRPHEDRMWPADLVDAAAQRHVSSEHPAIHAILLERRLPGR